MPSVKLLFGPMLIGSFFNCILYGVMIIQMFIYYQSFKRDASWIRYFVLYLFIIETVNTGCVIGMLYEPLIDRYATPEATTLLPLLLPSEPLLAVLISTPIQIFIAWRIRIISRSRILAGVICILALASFGGGLWLTRTITHVKIFARKPELHWPALLWLLASGIADVSITLSLIVNLARRKTGFSGTDDVINRIIRLSIQTGFITAVVAILDIVCFLVLPRTTINFIWDFALSKLYTNALMSTLNARAGWSDIAYNGIGEHNVLFSTMPEFTTVYDSSYAQTTRHVMSMQDSDFPRHPHSRHHSVHDRSDGTPETSTIVDLPTPTPTSSQEAS